MKKKVEKKKLSFSTRSIILIILIIGVAYPLIEYAQKDNVGKAPIFSELIIGEIQEIENFELTGSAKYNAPKYNEHSDGFLDNHPLVSGERVRIEGNFFNVRREDVGRVEIYGQSTGVRIKGGIKKINDDSITLDSLPGHLPSDEYEIKIFLKDNTIYTKKIALQGSLQTERTGVFQEVVLEEPKHESIIFQKHLGVESVYSRRYYWEMVMAGHPSNGNQLILGNSRIVSTQDGGETWNELELQSARNGFGGDPKLYVTKQGKVFLIGLENFYTYYEETGAINRQLLMGAFYTGDIEGDVLSGKLFGDVELITPSYSGRYFIIDRPTLAYDELSGRIFIGASNIFANGGRGATSIFISDDHGKTFEVVDLPSGSGLQQMDTTPNGEIRVVSRTGSFMKFIKFNSDLSEREIGSGPETLNNPLSGATTYLCTDSSDARCPNKKRTLRAFSGPEIRIDKNVDSPHYGRTHLVWAQSSEKDSFEGEGYQFGINFDIYYSYSDDDGESWSIAQKVNDDFSEANQMYPTVSIDPKGVVHVAFIDKREDPGAHWYNIYYTPIQNGEIHKNIKINEDPIPNIYGGRDHGDYLDYIVAYPGKVYISYPCVIEPFVKGGSSQYLLPRDVCLSAVNPGILYSENRGNTAPVVTFNGESSVAVGNELELRVLATDPEMDSLVLTANLEGEWSLLTIGASFEDNGGGLGTFSWVPSSEQVGIHDITFSASDGELVTEIEVSITVIPSSPEVKTSCDQCGDSLGLYCSKEECESIAAPESCFGIPSGLPAIPTFCISCNEEDVHCGDYKDQETCERNVCGLNEETGCIFISDRCEICSDLDNDSVCDQVDNCRDIFNPIQADIDVDGLGNACDEGTCGDEFIAISFGEECDDGEFNSDTVPDACRGTCTLPVCGDGVLDSGEECDDGNLENGDECSSTCELETDDPIEPRGCELTSAYFSETNVVEGESVRVIVGGDNCGQELVDFKLFEQDFFSGDDFLENQVVSTNFFANIALSTWVSSWQNDCGGTCNPPEYYFIATLRDGSQTISSLDYEGGILIVQKKEDIIENAGGSSGGEEEEVLEETDDVEPEEIQDDSGGKVKDEIQETEAIPASETTEKTEGKLSQYTKDKIVVYSLSIIAVLVIVLLLVLYIRTRKKIKRKTMGLSVKMNKPGVIVKGS